MLVFLLVFLVSSVSGSCPAGSTYNSQFNKCYQYIKAQADFLSAEKSCESLGGNLVSISNAFEDSYLGYLAWENSFSTEYWIGLNMMKTPDWIWTNGDNSSYRNWATGEPADPSAYQCAAVRDQDNYWTKELCNSTRPYMCQLNFTTTPTTPAVLTSPKPVLTSPMPGMGCPDGYCATAGYTLNPATCKCYKYYDRSLNISYNQSSVVCAKENSTLAIILSAEDNAFVSNFTSKQTVFVNDPWIGIWCTDYTVSSCQWADGSPVTYTNFAPGEPDRETPVYLDENDQMWYSFNYYLTGSFICQQQGKWSRNEMAKRDERVPKKVQQNKI